MIIVCDVCENFVIELELEEYSDNKLVCPSCGFDNTYQIIEHLPRLQNKILSEIDGLPEDRGEDEMISIVAEEFGLSSEIIYRILNDKGY